MITVGVRELKNRLSEYLRLVRAGEEILVTDRGEVVAELRRPERDRAPSAGALAELVRRTGGRMGGPNDRSLYSPMLPYLAPGEAQRLLDAERGER